MDELTKAIAVAEQTLKQLVGAAAGPAQIERAIGQLRTIERQCLSERDWSGAPASIRDAALQVLTTDQSDDEIRSNAARNRSVPWPCVSRLMGDPSKSVRMALAQRTDQPIDALSQLAQDEIVLVRLLLCSVPTLPPDIIDAFTRDPSDKVREQIVVTHSLSKGQLAALAADSMEDVRVAVATRPALTEELARVLVKDPSPKVRAFLHQKQNERFPWIPAVPDYVIEDEEII